MHESKVLYCPSKGHIFSFWPCYIRYALLIIDKFPVEFSLLLSLLHLSLETTYRFIDQRFFFQFCFLFLFYHEYWVSL